MTHAALRGLLVARDALVPSLEGETRVHLVLAGGEPLTDTPPTCSSGMTYI